MTVNGQGWSKLGHGEYSWQWAKHAWLYSDQLQALSFSYSHSQSVCVCVCVCVRACVRMCVRAHACMMYDTDQCHAYSMILISVMHIR